jgi:hypothetical protein
MTKKTFILESSTEAEKFESLVAKHMRDKGIHFKPHISLENTYTHLHNRKDGGRIFSSILDLYINFAIIQSDFQTAFAKNNALIWGKKCSKTMSILDSEQCFVGKFDILHLLTNAVLRIRSLWDKIMGLYVLLLAPKDYDRFYKGHSRKKSFLKIAVENKLASEDDLRDFVKNISDFDDKFRTAEAHGTGIFRKHILTTDTINDLQTELVGYFNLTNNHIAIIAEYIREGNLAITNHQI